MSIAERDDLEQRIREGAVLPRKLPKSLALTQIETLPGVFQHRDPRATDSSNHVREMAKALRNDRKGELVPVMVYWTGSGWVCIDGHHRLQAYAAEKRATVPVQVFEGTVDDAIAHAAENAHPKLQMGTQEKLNLAWRLVVMSNRTKSQTAASSGVAPRSVANMREVKAALLAIDPLRDLSQSSWQEARRERLGLAAPARPDHDEDREEREAQQIANKLLVALGPLRTHMVGVIFPRALEIYDRRLPDACVEYWQGGDEPGDEDTDF